MKPSMALRFARAPIAATASSGVPTTDQCGPVDRRSREGGYVARSIAAASSLLSASSRDSLGSRRGKCARPPAAAASRMAARCAMPVSISIAEANIASARRPASDTAASPPPGDHQRQGYRRRDRQRQWAGDPEVLPGVITAAQPVDVDEHSRLAVGPHGCCRKAAAKRLHDLDQLLSAPPSRRRVRQPMHQELLVARTGRHHIPPDAPGRQVLQGHELPRDRVWFRERRGHGHHQPDPPRGPSELRGLEHRVQAQVRRVAPDRLQRKGERIWPKGHIEARLLRPHHRLDDRLAGEQLLDA